MSELYIVDIILIVTLGFAIGSFLNVCIYRLPLNKSIVFPPSHCFQCQTPLSWRDLMPVLSYIVSKGRCRYCGGRYSVRYAVVEILTAILFLWCYYIFGLSLELAKALVFTPFLIVITYIDYDHQLILDKVLIALAVSGVIIEFVHPVVGWYSILMGSMTSGGLLLVIALISGGGMGGGDIKFAAALGMWLGLQGTLLTLFLSFLIGGIAGGIILLCKLKNRKDAIPFGPYIAISAFISLLYGNDIIHWYLNFVMGG